jgi:GT2 family glycosyltransferase
VIQITAVIPCRNARDTLGRVIDALVHQDTPRGDFEIIVVDDGSTDGSTDGLRDSDGAAPFRVLHQPNRGLAAARNLGAAQAQGAVVLFLDADVFAAPDLVRAHLRRHRAAGADVAVQGRTLPDPASITTPFMRTSMLIPDLTLRRRADLSPFHVIGRNFSITRRGLERLGGFDQEFAGYGFEDVELAYRFHEAGGRILYEPDAVGTHFHPMTIEQAAVRFWRKHGRRRSLALQFEIHPVFLPLKWLVFRTGWITPLVTAIRPWAERGEHYLILNECYNHLLWRGYYAGVFDALRTGSDRAPTAQVTPR